MRDPLRSFNRKLETDGYLLFPVFEHALLRQTIERIIDFNGRQTCRVVREHLLGRNFLRIKVALPFLVTVAACAYVESHSTSKKISALGNQGVTDCLMRMLVLLSSVAIVAVTFWFLKTKLVDVSRILFVGLRLASYHARTRSRESPVWS